MPDSELQHVLQLGPGTGDDSGSRNSLQARAAFERLVLMNYDRLLKFIRRQLPARLAGVQDPEDILQEACTEAFQRLALFKPQGPDSFYRWLATIARHRLIDAVRAHETLKRGGGALRITAGGCNQSMSKLLEHLAIHESTASRGARRKEAIAAMNLAVACLTDDMRRAVEFRYFSGLSVKETAAKMNRTERGIEMLCHRAITRLRESMGRASHFLSWNS